MVRSYGVDNAFVFTIIVISLIPAAFATEQTDTTEVQKANPLAEKSFVVIIATGILSLVISLIVFSIGTNIRTRGKGKGFTIEEIRENLEDLKRKVGEPAFTNLINGLSSAAKEELVFPEPIGVLRHKEFRRALTISVALTYFAILGFSTVADQTQSANFKDNPIIEAFAWVFVAVMAFYFGDKIFENYAKGKGVQVTANVLEPITIEEAKVSKDGEKLTVKIKNNLKSKIKVTKILVDDKPVSGFKAFEIEVEKSKPMTYDIQPGGKTVKVEIGQVAAEKEIKTEKGPGNNETTEAGEKKEEASTSTT